MERKTGTVGLLFFKLLLLLSITGLLLLFVPAPVASSSLDTPCADQLQRCGVLVEDFERQLLDLKNVAFRSCFINTACVHEKIAFDDCFAKSLQAVRAPFGDSALIVKSDFLSTSEHFRPQVEQCFAGLPAEETVQAGGGNRTQAGNAETDVAQLGRVVYGPELADRLWGLPSGDVDKEQLMDPLGGCSSKDGNNRVFGGGISRLLSDPSSGQLTNLNTSCTLGAAELACYRRALDHDPQYRLLMSSRDRALRSCIQNARLQSEANCQFGGGPAAHSCICSAREAMDGRMQSALISCVQHSPVAQLYAALVSLSNGGSTALQALPADSTIRFKPASSAGGTTGPPLPATSLQISEEPLSLSSSNGATFLTQGSIVSGQCLCACPQRSTVGQTLAASNDFSTGGRARLQPESTQQQVVAVPQTQAQQQQQQQVYSRPVPAAATPWYYQPLQTALSAEAGIANGFERFFNGQPPLKRRKKRAAAATEEQILLEEAVKKGEE